MDRIQGTGWATKIGLQRVAPTFYPFFYLRHLRIAFQTVAKIHTCASVPHIPPFL